MNNYNIKVNGNDYAVSIDSVDAQLATVSVNGTEFKVELDSSILPQKTVVAQRPAQTTAPAPATVAAAPVSRPSSGNSAGIKSPLPGSIIEMFVKEGDTVTAGQKLMVLEAMKMENNIEAEAAGTVTKLPVSKGSQVMEGDLLIVIE